MGKLHCSNSNTMINIGNMYWPFIGFHCMSCVFPVEGTALQDPAPAVAEKTHLQPIS